MATYTQKHQDKKVPSSGYTRDPPYLRARHLHVARPVRPQEHKMGLATPATTLGDEIELTGSTFRDLASGAAMHVAVIPTASPLSPLPRFRV